MKSAFTVVYNHFYNSIFSFCKYLLPGIEDARDMTAQLFILVWEKETGSILTKTSVVFYF